MRNCPNCGSSAQVRLIDMKVVCVNAEEEDMLVHKTYICGCGERFKTAKLYVPSELDHENIIDSWRNTTE
jgi:hypothetical protein